MTMFRVGVTQRRGLSSATKRGGRHRAGLGNPRQPRDRRRIGFRRGPRPSPRPGLRPSPRRSPRPGLRPNLRPSPRRGLRRDLHLPLPLVLQLDPRPVPLPGPRSAPHRVRRRVARRALLRGFPLFGRGRFPRSLGKASSLLSISAWCWPQLRLRRFWRCSRSHTS